MSNKLLSQSLFFALGEGAYIFLVALIIRNGDQLFGNSPGVLGIIAFLTLFVVSAAISGALILGKPTLLYLEGKKKLAIQHFALTLLWMLLFLVIVLSSMMIG